MKIKELLDQEPHVPQHVYSASPEWQSLTRISHYRRYASIWADLERNSDVSMLWKFDSYHSYIEWVNNWKTCYRVLSSFQREMKKSRRIGSQQDRSIAQSKCAFYRDMLRTMLYVRQYAREKSRQMKAAAKTALV